MSSIYIAQNAARTVEYSVEQGCISVLGGRGVYLMIHDLEQSSQVIPGEQCRGPKGGLHIGHHECRGQTFARGISNDECQAIVLMRDKIVAIAAQRPNLTAAGAIVEGIANRTGRLHEALLHIARQYPVLAHVHYHFVGRHSCLYLFVGSGAPKSTSGSDF